MAVMIVAVRRGWTGRMRRNGEEGESNARARWRGEAELEGLVFKEARKGGVRSDSDEEEQIALAKGMQGIVNNKMRGSEGEQAWMQGGCGEGGDQVGGEG